ncbi:hypothetical protein RN001_007029 [Aquatica leii]|uniref:CWH43-like N-terminal domain-containing protein n=1 Tax=Aquatica leii TaxID=1421715 RepID=A0AAN7SSD0_9COLE|nr:hypothetical protein RN001_007029 [Aquatica leii]
MTYIIAVIKKDVNPIFPYISDSGTFSPESCIFGQMLNTGAILMVMLIYVRHRQISYICEKHNLQHLVKSKNLISSWFGGLGAFGITIVGNFQETNVFFVHIIGAFLSFGFGAVWQVLQTWISFKVFPYSGTTSQNKIRFFFSTICVFSFVTSSFCGLLGWFYFTGDDPTKWRKNDGGFAFHIISTISEWINAVIFAAFVLTFAPELKNVGFEEPRIRIWEKVVVESVVISQSTLSNGEEFDRY